MHSACKTNSDFVTTPIVDLRHRLSWRTRCPAQLGTAALWLGSFSLLGPLKLSALLLAGSLAAPAVVVLERSRRQASVHAPVAAPSPSINDLPRSVVAAELGVSEAQLFRARHAQISIVHHASDGSIVALETPLPLHQPQHRSPDAHPVG